MKKLLHIIATPRMEESRTLKVSVHLLKRLQEKYKDIAMEELNLFETNLPFLDKNILSGKYLLLSGQKLSNELKPGWKVIEHYIEQFLKADIIVISTPMWNFGIPYTLKHYLDVIVQPQYLFRYTEKGPEGLAKGKKLIVVSTRGGDYSQEPSKAYDQQEPYLRTVFGFIGITDLTFIYAQPMDALGEEVQKQKIAEAIKAVNNSNF